MKLSNKEVKKVKAATYRRKRKQSELHLVVDIYLLRKRNTGKTIRILRARLVSL